MTITDTVNLLRSHLVKAAAEFQLANLLPANMGNLQVNKTSFLPHKELTICED